MSTVNNSAWVSLGNGPVLVTLSAGAAFVTQSNAQPATIAPQGSFVASTDSVPKYTGRSAGQYWIIGNDSSNSTYTTGTIPGFLPSQGLMGSLALNEYVVATLPPAASNINVIAAVTDATAVTNGTIVAGSGANKVNVKSNGTNWLIIA